MFAKELKSVQCGGTQ